MPIVTQGKVSFISFTAPGGMQRRVSDLRAIKKFYVPLPEDVLKDMPYLSEWQEDNWKAWESFLGVLNSPLHNMHGVFFGANARNRIVPAMPMVPCPLPKTLLDKYESLKQWQYDNAKAWHEICRILGLRVERAAEYNDDLERYKELTLEQIEVEPDVDLWE